MMEVKALDDGGRGFLTGTVRCYRLSAEGKSSCSTQTIIPRPSYGREPW
jgi:hypothetical protein